MAAEKFRPARRIQTGMDVQVSGTGEWVRVDLAVHMTAPIAVSSFRLADGRQASAYPDDEIMSRPGGAS